MTRPAAREERITLWAVVGRFESEWLDSVHDRKREAVRSRNSMLASAMAWSNPGITFVLRPITAVLKLSKPRARKGSR
jgi:hypothetical protein